MAAEKGKGAVAVSADADDGRIVKLKSSDEEIFEVPAKVAKQFKIIADVVDKGCADETIPLPNVHSSALAMVVEYCENSLRTNAQQPDARNCWDEEFVSTLDADELYDVTLAAHYLDHERLIDLSSKGFATIMQSKTVEQIRAIFGIENDYTPEEEAEIRAENAWAFEH